jgi:uncharacterized membrane protein YgaE (UPF0421/DUF939 family)
VSETKSNGNGNALWKFVGLTLSGLLLGILVTRLMAPVDTVTEKELSLQVLQLQAKIDSMTNEVVALRSSVNQQSVDIAGIAGKVGVTAHPVVAPSH